ncbi:white collar 1 protein [Phaffia rhodozyma]|uniref:White collar 1 protein n=1 Tax=Phaffia rhodozyma TaxID=264483 RepID=A0A0F7SES9_PHARH|nr:white collar 1 protein [Phaffia rhodozyma]
MANAQSNRSLDFGAYLVQTPSAAAPHSISSVSQTHHSDRSTGPPTGHQNSDPAAHYNYTHQTTQPGHRSSADLTLVPTMSDSSSPSSDQQPLANSPPRGLPNQPIGPQSSNSNSNDVNGALGWDPNLFSTSDLSFQLPSFLGPSSLAAPGGGVEAFPTRSVDDWNSSSFTPNGEMQFTEDGTILSGTGSLASGMGNHDWGDSSMWSQTPDTSRPVNQKSTPPAVQTSDSEFQSAFHNHLDNGQPSSTLSSSARPTTVNNSSSAYPSNSAHMFPLSPQKSAVLPSQPEDRPAYPNPTSHLLPSGPTDTSIPQIGKNMPGLYSSSGFDVLGVLSKVVSRPNPRTVLGPVDFSCSFLVVDVLKYDCPIVYSSPTFAALTGYENKEIVGRNCRFLQAPDGAVERGSRRKYTDNVAVSHLKRNLASGKECQASLINYRRGGVPFINLVTVVPIPWDTNEIRFHVGFQVDLVESPNAILRNLRDGTYQVNYAVLNNPQLPLAPAGQLEYQPRRIHGLSPELLDVIRVSRPKALEEAQAQGSEEATMAEWYKTLFDHSDDFIHVLSLKGQFQYCSPSVTRILEYDPSELVNKFIGDICHPSDLVPVMRELKDSTHTPSSGQTARLVNFSFRVQRKTSGMVWMECTGQLHVEPGKGRKAVILCGRERVVPTLQWASVRLAGGVGAEDSWCMLSFEGLILYASNKMKETFSSTDDELIGSSLLDYIPNRASSSPKGVSEPPHQRIRAALKLSSRSLPETGKSTTIRHALALPSGTSDKDGIVIADTVFYAVDKPESQYDWSPMQGVHNGPLGGAASPAESDQTDSFPVDPRTGPSQRKMRATVIVCQIKIVDSSGSSSARHAVRASSVDVFEELNPTRSTGWHYELHQLKNDNRRLRDQVESMRVARSRATQMSNQPGSSNLASTSKPGGINGGQTKKSSIVSASGTSAGASAGLSKRKRMPPATTASSSGSSPVGDKGHSSSSANTSSAPTPVPTTASVQAPHPQVLPAQQASMGWTSSNLNESFYDGYSASTASSNYSTSPSDYSTSYSAKNQQQQQQQAQDSSSSTSNIQPTTFNPRAHYAQQQQHHHLSNYPAGTSQIPQLQRPYGSPSYSSTQQPTYGQFQK